MLRWFSRLFTKLSIALSALPASRAALPPSEPAIQREFEQLEKAQGDYGVELTQPDRSYLHARYKGPLTPISDPAQMLVPSGARMHPVTSDRFRNRTVAPTDPDVDKFVADRSA